MVNNKENRVFLSRNYRLIVAPWKFDVLKTSIFALEASLLGQIFVLRTSNFQGATIRPIVPRHKINTLLSLFFTTKFSSARQLKNSQNPLNADQSNIYSWVQAVTNVNNSQRTLAKE